jgi:stage II sporulation protein D
MLFLFSGCVSTTAVKTRPSVKPVQEKSKPPEKKEIKDTIPEKKAASKEDELDFYLAFADTEEEQSQKKTVAPVQPKEGKKEKPGTDGLPVFLVPSNMVRIALQQNKGQIVLYSAGTLTIHSHGNPFRPACRGRISVTGIKKKESRSRVILGLSSKKKIEAFLPCTLLAKSAQNYIEFEEESYRGSVILAPAKGNAFSFINYCHIEEYLRGVVPLEIGKRPEEDIEAVKAQAIAARTYAYLRITKRQKKTFDLLPTVADQVYGGINAEDPLSDRAILLTKNIVLTYQDSLIYAYYHSTCGNMTADIQDVWHKDPQPYLRPIKDVDKNGKAYCLISRYYDWQESWSTHKLASLMRIYCKKTFPQTTPFKGNIRGIKVTDRFPCKRVKACVVKTNSGTYTYGGDKIRFLFRRNLSGHPILRSSRFKIVKANSKQIVLEGRGYGHGVGMCQMGALGRAWAGQSFEEILNAYYTGTTIATVKIQ